MVLESVLKIWLVVINSNQRYIVTKDLYFLSKIKKDSYFDDNTERKLGTLYFVNEYEVGY